jgi:dTDP-4-amino-4,6-dideoxygalactose transaminase
VTETQSLIPLVDVRLVEADLAAVEEVLRSGWLTMGPRTAEFEQTFASLLGCRHVVAVSSCTAALHLAYLAAGIGPGDEVIVPSFTFAATASTVLNCGGTPVFADILGTHDLSLDLDDVERRITPRTKAVALVHFGGYAGAAKRFRELCDAYGLKLIEDAAHTPKVEHEGRMVGTWGLAGAFSLFSNKILSVGEGGMLATDDDEVAEFARLRRSHAMTSGTWDRHSGRTDTYDVVGLGFNYRIDELRSALALSRLARLDADIERRRELTRTYRANLADVPGLEIPYTDEDVETSCCYVMPVLVRDPEERAAVRTRLRERHGVQTSIFYPSIHRFSAYRWRDPELTLPNTEWASRTELTIPLYSHLTDDEQQRVIAGLREELS